MRLRNKETVPLKLFADHAGFSDDAQFVLSLEGDSVVDALIIVDGHRRNLQFTLAAPIWGEGPSANGNSGYQHHQVMAALNEHECVVGYPPYSVEDGIAIGEIDTITSDQRDVACRIGLSSAISKKALYDGRGCTLIVFAQDFYCQLIDVELFQALVDTVLSEQGLSFEFSVCFR